MTVPINNEREVCNYIVVLMPHLYGGSLLQGVFKNNHKPADTQQSCPPPI